MACVRNIRRPEGLVRLLLGVLVLGGGLAWRGLTPLGLGIAATGAGAALTGLLGFCPACAMVGKKPQP